MFCRINETENHTQREREREIDILPSLFLSIRQQTQKLPVAKQMNLYILVRICAYVYIYL